MLSEQKWFYVLWLVCLPHSIFAPHNIIQGVSEIRVLILTSEKTRQFMKLFSIIFCKIRKVFQDFLPHNFYQTSRFV
jgi:hypothetical protein